jgi:hypothetical protein
MRLFAPTPAKTAAVDEPYTQETAPEEKPRQEPKGFPLGKLSAEG